MDRLVEMLKTYDLTTDLVIVAGDFNDTPGSAPLKNLMAVPNMVDVLKTVVPNWTYQTGNDQIDYLLVSQPIADNLTVVGIERRGIFRSHNPTFPEVTNKVMQASDHAAVFAEFEV